MDQAPNRTFQALNLLLNDRDAGHCFFHHAQPFQYQLDIGGVFPHHINQRREILRQQETQHRFPDLRIQGDFLHHPPHQLGFLRD